MERLKYVLKLMYMLLIKIIRHHHQLVILHPTEDKILIKCQRRNFTRVFRVLNHLLLNEHIAVQLLLVLRLGVDVNRAVASTGDEPIGGLDDHLYSVFPLWRVL